MHSISGVGSCTLHCSTEAKKLHCPYSKESLLCLERHFRLLHRAVPCAQSADVAPLSRCVLCPSFLSLNLCFQLANYLAKLQCIHLLPLHSFLLLWLYTKIHLTFLTNSAPAYTRQFSLQCPFPLYSPTIRSSTAFRKLCWAMILLQKGLLIPLRSPFSLLRGSSLRVCQCCYA